MKKIATITKATIVAGLLISGCATISGAADTATSSASRAVTAAASTQGVQEASFTSTGAVRQPVGYREWIYIGTPLTPNALNGGAAAFPEFHNVYVEPTAFKHFERTGEWADGTQIAKELVSVRSNNNDEGNGSSQEVSGRGYFMGEFVGLELAVKDSSRYADEPGNWAYFSFGHTPEPYAATAEAFPAESCNACHAASAETDFVFSQFYPVVRAAQN